MKKLVSLLLAVTLLVGVCAVSAVAFAEEAVTVDDLVGAWAGVDGDGNDLGSRIKFAKNEFSGKIEYKKNADSPAVSVAVSGKYTLEAGALKVTDESPKNLSVVLNPDNSVTFNNYASGDGVVAQTLTRREIVYGDAQKAVYQAEIVDTACEIHKAQKDFKLDYTWLKDPAKVAQIFGGINYKLKEGENVKDYELDNYSDKVYVEYCSPSYDYKDASKWTAKQVTNTTEINISSTGWWCFRFSLRDSNGTVLTDSNGKDIKTGRINIYFHDEDKPVITSISTDMKTAQKEGIKVGATYTIKTNVTVDSAELSSRSVYYNVYKSVDGAWKLIYDSEDGNVVEGYADCLENGVITMKDGDILPDNSPIYKIVYRARDNQGFNSDTEEVADKNVLTLFAKAADPVETKTEKKNKVNAWSIVLYVVAGLSAVGIVVVLCIKPKNKVAEDSRVAEKSEKSDK